MKFESLPEGVRLVVEAAQSKKAGGITVLNLNGHAAFTEYFRDLHRLQHTAITGDL